MERKVPKYEYHKIREKKVKTIQFPCVCPTVISSISGKSFHFPFSYFVIFLQIITYLRHICLHY